MSVRLVSLERHQTHTHRPGLRLAAGEEVAGAGGRVQERRFWYLRVQPQAGLGELDGVLVAGRDALALAVLSLVPRVRLAIQEMNYVSRRVVERQAPWTVDPGWYRR
jgi:hypothetical protein